MQRKQLPIYILIGLITIVLILTVILAIIMPNKSKRSDTELASNPESQTSHTESSESGNSESESDPFADTIMPVPDPGVLESITSESSKNKFEEGVVTYKGQKYRYNTKIKTYLLMGVDRNGKVGEDWNNYYDGGQSDAMFLLVADGSDKTLSVISIQRNSMTLVTFCDDVGHVLGDFRAQICLSHGYGDGKALSCKRAVNSVSYLFRNQKIDGYFAMNMGGLPLMNDGLGGVELTVIEDIPAGLKKGETVRLSGEQAYWYLRWRNRPVFDSASMRLRRQEQYITAFMTQLDDAAKHDKQKALNVFDSIQDYVVTNIDFVELLDVLSEYEYNESRLYTVPGETVMGTQWEEYNVDEDGLEELIYKVFYNPVNE